MRESHDETILFARLLAREPDAITDLAEAYLEKLCATLRRQFSALPPSVCSDDFAIDSLLRLGKNPHQYQPKRGMSLFSYLVQDARGDVLNALAKERRQEQFLSSSVEHLFFARNTWCTNDTEATALEHLVDEFRNAGPPTPQTALDDFLRRAAPAMREPYDAVLVELLWREERKTEPYARAMGLDNCTPEEQKLLVKKAKDRLKVAIKRLGDLE